jgi:hypothetical protein
VLKLFWVPDTRIKPARKPKRKMPSRLFSGCLFVLCVVIQEKLSWLSLFPRRCRGFSRMA